ncbi:MAG: hypothetical protein KJ850_11560 [Gammaproteobacteria bacterium]|nr:hypothetical protein [Gammaproteobacteria bacterium]MBU1625667.1 hypothetical protein [Gammaproteobacteria bacterium]MBU1980927.1 hypothetical protein [Gammaproteobacteria bacterium]
MQANNTQRGLIVWIISLVAVGSGIMTLKGGGTVLFGDDAARVAAGNYVPLLLWFNFLSGFVYIAAGIGLWLQRRWAIWLSIGLLAAIAIAFAAFGMHISSGGVFEQRTVIAMSARLLIWTVIAALAARTFRRI